MEHYAGLFVVQDDTVLLVQEASARAFGQWSLPAGHVEPGESDDEAAIREGKEETGYEFDRLRRIEERQYYDPPYVYVIFSAEVVGGELKVNPQEHLDVRWVPFPQVPSLNFRPSNMFVKDYVRTYTEHNEQR